MSASDKKRILASRRVNRLTLAVILKDDARPDKHPDGEIFLKADGVDRKPALYGVYPLVDMRGNKFSITVGGKYYQEQTILIDTTGLDPKNPFKEITLAVKVSP